jgi:hypothetical protein
MTYQGLKLSGSLPRAYRRQMPATSLLACDVKMKSFIGSPHGRQEAMVCGGGKGTDILLRGVMASEHNRGGFADLPSTLGASTTGLNHRRPS